MSMLDRITAQFVEVEQEFNELLNELEAQPSIRRDPVQNMDKKQEHHGRQCFGAGNSADLDLLKIDAHRKLAESVKILRTSIDRLNIISQFENDVRGQYRVHDVIDATLNAMWNRMDLRYVVLILGERELGPYYYQGMKGEPNPRRHLLYECPFPLSGSLAHTVLRRKKDYESDYLYIKSLKYQKSPSVDEFTWLPPDGSLLILPLRTGTQVIGAIMLGTTEVCGFDDDTTRQDLYDLASLSAEAIHTALTYQEVSSSAEKLVNAQWLTRELATVENYYELISLLTDKLPQTSGKFTVQLYLQHKVHQLGTREPIAEGLSPLTSQLQLISRENNACSAHQRSATALTKLVEWVIKVGQPIFYDPDKVEQLSDYSFYEEYGNGIIVPIADNFQNYGALNISVFDKHRPLEESDMVLFRTIANSAASAFTKLQSIQEKESLLSCALQPLVEIVESQFPALRGHSCRTAYNATLLAKQLGIGDEACASIRMAAAFHDVGIVSCLRSSLSMLTTYDEAALARSTAESLEASCQILRSSGIDSAVRSIVHQFGEYRQYIDDTYGFHETIEAPVPKNTLPVSRAHDQDYLALAQLHRTQTKTYSQNGEYRQPTCIESGTIKANAIISGLSIDRSAQVVTLVEALDQFLIQTALDLSSVTISAREFLDDVSGTLFESGLVDHLHNLLERDLIMLPGKNLFEDWL